MCCLYWFGLKVVKNEKEKKENEKNYVLTEVYEMFILQQEIIKKKETSKTQ